MMGKQAVGKGQKKILNCAAAHGQNMEPFSFLTEETEMALRTGILLSDCAYAQTDKIFLFANNI